MFDRDRSPFVLTSDMAYVINGGDKPSAKFHLFVDRCCKAFNIVRKHGNLILNLFGLVSILSQTYFVYLKHKSGLFDIEHTNVLSTA